MCADQNAEIVYLSSSEEEDDQDAETVHSSSSEDEDKCKCKDGYISSSATGVKNFLEKGETCVPVLGSNNIQTSHDSITVQLDSTVGDLLITDVEVIRHGKY